MSATEVAVTLVNPDQTEVRTVVVQTGAYREHRFSQAFAGSARSSVDRPYVRVRLDPGCGERTVFQQARYAEQLTFTFPWDRAE